MLESKTKNVESKTEKCGVQISIFTSRNQLFWALTDSSHSIQSSLIVLPDVVAITQYTTLKVRSLTGVSKNIINISARCFLFIEIITTESMQSEMT